MKTNWIPVLLLAAVNAGAKHHDPDVVVFFHHGTESAAAIGLAEQQATRMLADAGITVAWRLGNPHREGQAELIEAVLMEQPDPKVRAGALAFATLGVQSGTRIEIYYNRLRNTGRDAAVPPVLAHVLVHEITHVLEGVDRHSESGVMKAHWDPQDFLRMRSAPMPFAIEDLGLLRAWVARRDHSQIAGLR